ncbi:hypothetical protein [Rhodococcoides yunnanense]|uniref:hypothetical protein n=1 Tax=Rhodococcoides yunnanense TaxID=278209 RepID=UPI0011149ACA|nr:hypothetical protein [Rhodococcus yunnanensis]
MSSALWAIPIAFAICSIGFGSALILGLVTDSEQHTIGDYIQAVLVGFFLWGALFFVATSWFVIPALATVVAAARYSVLRWIRPAK